MDVSKLLELNQMKKEMDAYKALVDIFNDALDVNLTGGNTPLISFSLDSALVGRGHTNGIRLSSKQMQEILGVFGRKLQIMEQEFERL